MVGLASDVESTLDLGHELKQLVGSPTTKSSANNKSSDNNNEESTAATYVNQWRFQSVNSKVHNGEYYFNCSLLSGNKLLKQFLEVLSGG